MKKLTMPLATLIVFAGLPAISAQSETPQNEPAAAEPQQQTQQQSITGCLQKGTGDSYILTTQDGQQVLVTGSPDLSKHVGHTVRLIGTMSGKGEEAAFKASKVELIADKCNL